ncbi:MAG: HlyC/CorC family transporter [Anaerolineae bacterium]|nr:HlyC/CorC family transporter [Anaerolineae bacterium]
MGTALGLVAVAVLVFMNGFFVAAEFALVGARRTRITQLAEEGNAGARAAQQAIEHLDSYIAATQLGITLASLGLGWIGEPAVAHLFEPLLDLFLPEHGAETLRHTLEFGVAFGLVTMLHIVFGELAPKSIALQRAEKTAIIVARPTTWFLRLFRPVIFVMNSVGNAVVRLMGFEPASGHEQVHSIEELAMLVHSSREAGVLEASEERLIRNVFDFGDIPVREVMQPRVEVDGISQAIALPVLLRLVAAQHHSRYPVYAGGIDHVVGILHTKDLLDAIIAQPSLLSDGGTLDLKPLLRDPLFVPAMARVDEVLDAMKRTKSHVAIVLDEYGGMAGLATMEDILEELVGDVRDEFDDSLNLPSSPSAGVVVLDGLTGMSDVIERFGEPEHTTQAATIGGYVVECLDRIPELGDTVAYGGYDVHVETMDGMRVARVRFVRQGTGAASSGEG